MTQADAYFGQPAEILRRRASVKRQTLKHRRSQHRKIVAWISTPDEAKPPL